MLPKNLQTKSYRRFTGIPCYFKKNNPKLIFFFNLIGSKSYNILATVAVNY